jgi:hypothetical protein
MKFNSAYAGLACAVMVAVGTPLPLSAQESSPARERLRVVDSSKVQIITIQDGSSLVGRISALRADSVDFETKMGRLSISISDIREIVETDARKMRGGQYWFPNPNTTRLFFAPTGQMLKKGEGYFADYQLFFPGVAYGLTDNVSMGGGISLFPVALDEQVYYLTPKVGRSFGDNVHLAAGVLFVSFMGGGNNGTGGVGYGVATLGEGDGSVTMGLGYGFAGGNIESKPVAMLGGEKRVSRRIALVTENYLLPVSESNVVYSFGLRFMGERITTDLAIFNFSGSNIIGLPFVDFVFKF